MQLKVSLKIRSFFPLFFMVFIGIWFCLSCATGNPYLKIDAAVDQGDHQTGIAILEKDKKAIYRDKDAILYYLDKGMLTHYAENYNDSTQLLQEGERAIEEAFTKSITMEIGSYLLNDKTKEYDGEDYEDIYINVFNALNYYHNHKMEDALVEIRRMNNKLRSLASKYGELRTNLQQKALAEGGTVPPNPESSVQFSDSALARYLGMLFYRAIGNYDDARIDGEQLKVAFVNAPSVYAYPLPPSLDEELEIPPGKARLNVLGFSGLSPIKTEEVMRIPLPDFRYIKIALPVMTSRPSQVHKIEVVFDNGNRFDLALLEDMEAVARETFKEKVNLIYLKAVIRATVKGVTSSVLDAAAEETDGGTSLLFNILSLGTQVFAEASEQADLRLSRYFPAKAYVGGITLDPGTYSFTTHYYGASGGRIASFDHTVTVREDQLNLVEVVCLK
ncbi:MAG: hypothetical protein LBB80_10580 [Treponema sp.]|jgi:hypothetical protein|nr:hypothetical protein [Treponema sp.]